MAGITTSGTTIRFEDNTHPDAGGDGSYSFADIAAKLPAIFHDLNPGATHRMYGSDYALQNGDGVGSAATTLLDSDCTVEFAPTKSYSVSATGAGGRRTEFGTLIEGAAGKPTGIKGVNLIQQATSSFRGQMALYGSRIVMESGILNLTPGVAGLFAEAVNCIVDSNSTVTLGAAGVNALRRLYNINVGVNGLGSRVTNMVADLIERIVLGGQGMPNIFGTGAPFDGKDIVFAGTPTGGGAADFNYTGVSEVNLIQPTWSGNAKQINAAGAFINEWWLWDPFVFDPITGGPIEGVTLRLYDKNGVLLVDGVTDSLGRIDYGSGNFLNMVKARRMVTSGPGIVEEFMGPMLLRANLDGTVNSNYNGTFYRFLWPYVNLPGGFGKQLQPIGDSIPLIPKYTSAGIGAGWQEVGVDAAA